MPIKGKKDLINFQKKVILSKSKKILTCGDKKIVKAFMALIEAQVKIIRLVKKK